MWDHVSDFMDGACMLLCVVCGWCIYADVYCVWLVHVLCVDGTCVLHVGGTYVLCYMCGWCAHVVMCVQWVGVRCLMNLL